MTEIFMLRIRLRTCQGVVPGFETTPPLELLTNSAIKPRRTDWTECGDARLLGSRRNSQQTSYVALERD
jgi:hypothetical protein